MDWNRLGPETGTYCLIGSKNSSDRRRIKKFRAHLQIQQRINIRLELL